MLQKNDIKNWNLAQIHIWRELCQTNLVCRNDTQTFLKFSLYFEKCITELGKMPTVPEVIKFLGLGEKNEISRDAHTGGAA